VSVPPFDLYLYTFLTAGSPRADPTLRERSPKIIMLLSKNTMMVTTAIMRVCYYMYIFSKFVVRSLTLPPRRSCPPRARRER
jgi:hypothetical protein